MSELSEITVVLVDFQFLTRKAIASLIEETPGYCLVSQIKKPENLTTKINSIKPDLVVLDVYEKNSGYLEEVINLQNKGNIKLLVITNSQNPKTIQALLKSGIKGMVTKNCSEIEIINALKAVSIGQRFYCNTILNSVLESNQQEVENCEPTTLSPRELQVLKLIANGNITAKIAEKLHISIHTVSAHRKNILRKLNITSPIHLVAYAVESGLVSVDHKKR